MKRAFAHSRQASRMARPAGLEPAAPGLEDRCPFGRARAEGQSADQKRSPSSRPPVAAACAAPYRRPPPIEPRNPTRALREPAGDERDDALRAALVEPQLAPEVAALCAVREAEREAHVEHPRI